MMKNIDRRRFLGSTAAATSFITAQSYGRILGANDRVNIGFVGCGGRGAGHRRMVKMSAADKNLGVVGSLGFTLMTVWIFMRGVPDAEPEQSVVEAG